MAHVSASCATMSEWLNVPGGLGAQPLQKGRVGARQFPQSEHGQTVERHLKDGQDAQGEHRREHAPQNAVPCRSNVRDPVEVDKVELGEFEEQHDGKPRDAEEHARQEQLPSRLDVGGHKHRERAAGKAEHERDIDGVGRGIEIVREGVDDEHQKGKDEVEDDRLPPPEQEEADEGEHRHGTQIDRDEAPAEIAHQHGQDEDEIDEKDVPSPGDEGLVLEVVVIKEDGKEQEHADARRKEAESAVPEICLPCVRLIDDDHHHHAGDEDRITDDEHDKAPRQG